MLEDCRLLVTGLTGNLGGSIAEALVKSNEVRGSSRYTRAGELEKWKAAGVKTVVGDYAEPDYDGLPDDFDYVVHCAANTRPKTFAEGMRDNADGVGRLMGHCRTAKAFLHVSATAVYADNPDPEHFYEEDDLTGSGKMGHYSGTKLAGEGAARAMSAHLGLPVLICRLNIQCGPYKDGGLYGIVLAQMLRGDVVKLPAGETNVGSPVSNADLVDFVEPCLKAASVPGTTINWGGDEPVSTVEVIEYLAELAGVPARWELSEAVRYPTSKLDPTFRQSIAGRCKLGWREMVKDMYQALAPRLAA